MPAQVVVNLKTIAFQKSDWVPDSHNTFPVSTDSQINLEAFSSYLKKQIRLKDSSVGATTNGVHMFLSLFQMKGPVPNGLDFFMLLIQEGLLAQAFDTQLLDTELPWTRKMAQAVVAHPLFVVCVCVLLEIRLEANRCCWPQACKK